MIRSYQAQDEALYLQNSRAFEEDRFVNTLPFHGTVLGSLSNSDGTIETLNYSTCSRRT